MEMAPRSADQIYKYKYKRKYKHKYNYIYIQIVGKNWGDIPENRLVWKWRRNQLMMETTAVPVAIQTPSSKELQVLINTLLAHQKEEAQQAKKSSNRLKSFMCR